MQANGRTLLHEAALHNNTYLVRRIIQELGSEVSGGGVAVVCGRLWLLRLKLGQQWSASRVQRNAWSSWPAGAAPCMNEGAVGGAGGQGCSPNAARGIAGA